MRYLLLLAVFFISTSAEAQWIKKFNFRATSGYCTDGTNETYVVGDSYPTTRNSVTFGWTAAYGDRLRDRDAAKCSRHAGTNRNDNGTNKTFQVDLPSTGTYRIRIAMGEATNSETQYFEIKDGSTDLATCSGVSTTANQYADSGCTVRTSHTDWDSNAATLESTFATTTLNIQVGPDSVQSGTSTLAHLSIEQVQNTNFFAVLNAMGEL
jgi:hypothetical protein